MCETELTGLSLAEDALYATKLPACVTKKAPAVGDKAKADGSGTPHIMSIRFGAE